MREWEAYPSTGDMPMIAGAQEIDGVLACVKGARERIAKGHTETSYISSSWPGEVTYVCAMGGIFAEDGLTSKDIGCGLEGRELLLLLETRLSEDAKEAIRLLDEAALEVVPESAQWEKTRWAGPLEWVNQDWYSYEYQKHGRPDVGTKEKILEIYDLVIERQSQVGV